MLLFLAYGYPVGTRRKAYTEEITESACKLYYFVLFTGLGFPYDGVKRIIQEMGVNLCLHGAEFGFSKFLCVEYTLFHHGIKVLCHGINLSGKVP